MACFSSNIFLAFIRACDEQQHWKELTYLYIQCDEFDNAATTIMIHSLDAWDHMQFKDVCVKVAHVELYSKAVHFYLEMICVMFPHPSNNANHARCISHINEIGNYEMPKTIAPKCVCFRFKRVYQTPKESTAFKTPNIKLTCDYWNQKHRTNICCKKRVPSL